MDAVSPVIMSCHCLELSIWRHFIMFPPIPRHFVASNSLTPNYWFGSFFVTDTCSLPNMLVIVSLLNWKARLGIPGILVDILINRVSILVTVKLFKVNFVLTLDLLFYPLSFIFCIVFQRVGRLFANLLFSKVWLPSWIIIFVKFWLQEGRLVSVLC